MMFMMPMPPTSSEMLAMEASSMVKTLEVSWAVAAMSVWLRTVKSSSPPSGIRWASRMIAVTSAWADSICSSETARTRIWLTCTWPLRRVSTVE